MTVLMSIWGTPGWANHGKGPNYAPTRMSDLTNFAKALASRYSGRYAGYPFVGYFSIWNEPNLQQFLAPTYRNGKPYSPLIYAKIARAAYAGIKAGNRRALVAIGETSPHGHLRPLNSKHTQDSVAPAVFAQYVAKARPKVRFDAWAHHPYSDLGQSPTQRVRYPNVNLPQLPRFEGDLDKWFHRKNIPVWVTEYGFQTKPAQPRGVTLSQQASYLRKSLAMVRKDQNVQMFIWFIFRDEPVSPWQSGLETRSAGKKPAFAAFTAAAKPLDVRDPVIRMRAGKSDPSVRIPVWDLLVRDGVGANVGATMSITYKSKTISVTQPTATIGIDGYVDFDVPITKAKPSGEYRVFLTIGDANGNSVSRTVTIISD
jgi:Glycosyl hydrolase catalytic core